MECILIIEDNKNVRQTLKDILSAQQYMVFDEPNGRLGIARALETNPDLILCDVMMPEMNGFETLKAIRKVKGLSMVPFIFLTAKVDHEAFRNGMNLGADDFLTKPFNVEELLKVVKLRLDKAHKNQAAYQVQIEQLKLRLEDQNQKIRQYAFFNSHELRAPVARILGLMDLLLNNYIKTGEISDGSVLTMLQDSCSELDALVLEISQILQRE